MTIENASRWLGTFTWGRAILRQLEAAEGAEDRQKWLCMVLEMRVVIEKHEAILAGEEFAAAALEAADPTGPAAMAARLDD